jgi:hypothetical protein
MTGSGFHYSLLDVLSLRQALAGIASGEAVAPALTQFERARSRWTLISTRVRKMA